MFFLSSFFLDQRNALRFQKTCMMPEYCYTRMGSENCSIGFCLSGEWVVGAGGGGGGDWEMCPLL